MTPEDARRMYRSMARSLENDPTVCSCGRPKGTRSFVCLSCRELTRDAQERAEAEQWEPA